MLVIVVLPCIVAVVDDDVGVATGDTINSVAVPPPTIHLSLIHI